MKELRRRSSRVFEIVLVAVMVLAAGGAQHAGMAQSTSAPDAGWPTYGGDPGGQRFSPATQIRPANVSQLRPAWVTHTGALDGNFPNKKRASFENTPVLFRGLLYISTQFDQVLALDPATGAIKWRFDPHIRHRNLTILTSRGVATWTSQPPSAHRANTAVCTSRIFLGTLDARLLAIDANTGSPCLDFGTSGAVDLSRDIRPVPNDEYEITSAPTVVGDIVVTGSAIGDNHGVEEERGLVRGYDVRTGKQLWAWDPMPWAEGRHPRTGAGNTWSTISADPEHGLLFLPTSSPSPDFYGAFRIGDDRDADSLVALDAKTGVKRWAFQLVHHNLWDYDVAAQPLLFTFRGNIPAVAVATKMGTVFVLNRLTGEPLYPVSEQAAPASDVPGETAWPTQPHSALPPMVPQQLTADQAWGPTEFDRQFCHDKIAALRNEGVFTPPSRHGSLLYPGSLGGVNWGSLAFDPSTGMLYANNNNQPFLVRLEPNKQTWWHDQVAVPLATWMNGWKPGKVRNSWLFRWVLSRFYPDEGFQSYPQQMESDPHFGKEFSAMQQTPYITVREPLISPSGLPCSPPPWGAVTAMNLNTGKLAWQTPLGSADARFPGAGSIGLGGPIVTASGLVFTAAAKDDHIRAFDARTGQLLWTGDLPVPAQATPMTYVFQGRQYVVIADGGHGGLGTTIGDAVVAFSLPLLENRTATAKAR